MNAPASCIPAPPAPLAGAEAAPPSQRQDGWTAERRRAFLMALAEGHTVEEACAGVGLSIASAYALRRRANGAAFALGWRAACLLARERLADVLMARAIDGQVDTYTRADGTIVTRHRHDNRLAMAMLTRLDRMAGQGAAPLPVREGEAPAPVAASDAAQLVAGDFEPFLDMVGAGEDGAGERAAAARFVAARADAPCPQLPQLRDGEEGGDDPDAEEEEEDEEEDPPVWFDEVEDCWMTIFPPPPGFRGLEYGAFGEEDYSRALSREEQAAHEASEAAETARRREEESAARDRWFGFRPKAEADAPPALDPATEALIAPFLNPPPRRR